MLKARCCLCLSCSDIAKEPTSIQIFHVPVLSYRNPQPPTHINPTAPTPPPHPHHWGWGYPSTVDHDRNSQPYRATPGLLFPRGRYSSRVLGRPGPGPDRLGFKCYLAWEGARVVGEKGVISCTSNVTFHWALQKIMLKAFVHTSFSIRVFWLR